MTDIDERTYYELLGVEPTATTEEIKEAYREIARIFHPDSNFYSDIIADTGPEDNDVFKAITAAYQVLVNEQKRKEYDVSLNLDLYEGWDEGAPSKTRYEDVPEEWRKEREYFEEHFEEILKPAPKTNLVGSEERVDGDLPDETEPLGEASEPRIQLSRFGRVASESELSYVSSIPTPRRPHRASYDIVDILLFVGLPIMLVVVIVELLVYL